MDAVRHHDMVTTYHKPTINGKFGGPLLPKHILIRAASDSGYSFYNRSSTVRIGTTALLWLVLRLW
jgi:hypothetical protein